MTKNTELNRDLILTSLSRFYATPAHIRELVSILEGGKLSLRLIDWFVSSYCKNHNVQVGKYDMYADYRSQLKAFSKHNFDPFRRRDRIKYYYAPDAFVMSTLGQLNFFRWAIHNKVISYIMDHVADIEEDMSKVAKKDAAGCDGCRQVAIVPAPRMLTFT